jgi:hypothetical protein
MLDERALPPAANLPKIYCQQGARQPATSSPGDIISEPAGDIVGIRIDRGF